MKTKIVFFSLLFLLFSCQKRNEIPVNSKLIAKYVVFEDSISSKIIKNLKTLKEFDNKKDDGKNPFKLDGKVYKVETEYRLGSDGYLKKLLENIYHSFSYSDYGLKRIEIKDKETLGQTFSLKFSTNREQIIDCGDTLEIEKVYPKEKLIFVKPKRKDRRVNIYEFK